MTVTPFSYINIASVDLNKVCLHISYLFLKELVFVSDVFLLALFTHENLHSFKWYQESHFTGIDSSSDIAVSSTQLIYSFMSFFSFYLFYCHNLLIYFFQIDRLEPSFTDSVFHFCFCFCEFVILFP